MNMINAFNAIDKMVYLAERYLKEMAEDESRKDEQVIVIDHADLSERFMPFGATDSFGERARMTMSEIEQVYASLSDKERKIVADEFVQSYIECLKGVKKYQNLVEEENKKKAGIECVFSSMYDVDKKKDEPAERQPE